jgi:hypothetical protein
MLTHEEGGRSYLCGASSKITFVLFVLCANSFSEESPLFDSFLLMSLVPPKKMIVSRFVRLEDEKCLEDVIPLISALGLVVPITLKELHQS